MTEQEKIDFIAAALESSIGCMKRRVNENPCRACSRAEVALTKFRELHPKARVASKSKKTKTPPTEAFTVTNPIGHDDGLIRATSAKEAAVLMLQHLIQRVFALTTIDARGRAQTWVMNIEAVVDSIMELEVVTVTPRLLDETSSPEANVEPEPLQEEEAPKVIGVSMAKFVQGGWFTQLKGKYNVTARKVVVRGGGLATPTFETKWQANVDSGSEASTIVVAQADTAQGAVDALDWSKVGLLAWSGFDEYMWRRTELAKKYEAAKQAVTDALGEIAMLNGGILRDGFAEAVHQAAYTSDLFREDDDDEEATDAET